MTIKTDIMKRLILNYIGLAIMLSGLVGCEKSLMDFSGHDAVYFDVQRGPAWIAPEKWSRYYHTDVNFMETENDTTEVDIQVAIEGEVKEYDRPFKVEVIRDSSDAERGKFFDIEEEGIIQAGAAKGFVRTKVYRQNELIDNPRQIMIQLKSNEYFSTDLSFSGALPGRTEILEADRIYPADPLIHTIVLKYEVLKPKGWPGADFPVTPSNPKPYEGGLWGAYTTKKFLLMMEITGLQEESFQNMPSSFSNAVNEKMGRYLEEQFALHNPILEADGRLMWVSSVRSWRSYQYEWKYQN